LITNTRYTCVLQPDGFFVLTDDDPTQDAYAVLARYRELWESEKDESTDGN